MEWVETTGRTVEEAKDAALDQLGVDEADAEFLVLEEPRGGLFGRLRSEARVRARVRPTRPRPKADRRDRRRRRRGEDDRAARRGGDDDTADRSAEGGGREVTRPAQTSRGRSRSRGGRGRGRQDAGGRTAVEERAPRPASDDEETRAMAEGPELEEQARVVEEFVDGLVGAFGLDGTTTGSADEENEIVEVAVDGDDLGLLIGPKGQTLEAIQELARTVLQRATVGAPNARVRVDVGGYRERRREALERFARSLADQVLESGQPTALEPMGAADRKVVHDALNDVEGVTTTSEGVEPRRHVVILPESQDD